MTANQDKTRELIQGYLFRNRSNLKFSSVDETMVRVRLWVLPAGQLSEAELRSIILHFYIVNMIFPPNILPMPSMGNPKIEKAVKEAVKSPNEGVEVEREGGKLHISISGITAELNRGFGKTAVGVSWRGTLTLEETLGNFHFSGELSKTRWELKLSYPQETAVPDLTRLGAVFGEGEAALRGIIQDSQGLSEASEIRKKWQEFNEHMEGVKQAVETLKGISKAPVGKVNLGLALGSPPPLPGQETIPEGIQIILRLTFLF